MVWDNDMCFLNWFWGLNEIVCSVRATGYLEVAPPAVVQELQVSEGGRVERILRPPRHPLGFK